MGIYLLLITIFLAFIVFLYTKNIRTQKWYRKQSVYNQYSKEMLTALDTGVMPKPMGPPCILTNTFGITVNKLEQVMYRDIMEQYRKISNRIKSDN
jgi:hypothetical protein